MPLFHVILPLHPDYCTMPILPHPRDHVLPPHFIEGFHCAAAIPICTYTQCHSPTLSATPTYSRSSLLYDRFSSVILLTPPNEFGMPATKWYAGIRDQHATTTLHARVPIDPRHDPRPSRSATPRNHKPSHPPGHHDMCSSRIHLTHTQTSRTCQVTQFNMPTVRCRYYPILRITYCHHSTSRVCIALSPYQHKHAVLLAHAPLSHQRTHLLACCSINAGPSDWIAYSLISGCLPRHSTGVYEMSAQRQCSMREFRSIYNTIPRPSGRATPNNPKPSHPAIVACALHVNATRLCSLLHYRTHLLVCCSTDVGSSDSIARSTSPGYLSRNEIGAYDIIARQQCSLCMCRSIPDNTPDLCKKQQVITSQATTP